jgi:ARG/rhodanese/phosphatase superfamily protein
VNIKQVPGTYFGGTFWFCGCHNNQQEVMIMKNIFTSRKIKVLCAFFILVMTVSVGLSAYVEYRDGKKYVRIERDREDYRKKPPEKPYYPRHRPPSNPVIDLVRGIKVADRMTYRNMEVYTLERRIGSYVNYRTLDEALRSRDLKIYESSRENYRYVTVENTGRYYVFMMAGEVLLGGWQNRAVSRDTIIPPRSGQVRVPVYCVEEGRWHGTRKSFYSGDGMIPHSLRSSASKGVSQEQLWSGLSRIQGERSLHDRQGDFQVVYRDRKYRSELREYSDRFQRYDWNQTIGIVVVIDKRIVGVDIFGSAKLYRKLHQKIIEGYAQEAIRRHGRGYDNVSYQDVDRFLERVEHSRFYKRHAEGDGYFLAFSSLGFEGEALINREHVVHCLILPDDIKKYDYGYRKSYPDDESDWDPGVRKRR